MSSRPQPDATRDCRVAPYYSSAHLSADHVPTFLRSTPIPIQSRPSRPDRSLPIRPYPATRTAYKRQRIFSTLPALLAAAQLAGNAANQFPLRLPRQIPDSRASSFRFPELHVVPPAMSPPALFDSQLRGPSPLYRARAFPPAPLQMAANSTPPGPPASRRT